MEDAVLAESANTVEDVLAIQCQCPQIVDSIEQINQQPGCSGDIDGIDDIVDAVDYNQPLGKHICELEETSKLFKNDLLLVSQLSSDLAWTSRKVSFKNLKSQLLKDLVGALELGTMAYEDKDHWALTSHNHDAAYNKIEWHPNPEYTEHTTDVSCLAMIHISTETLTATDIDHNPKDRHVDEQHLSVNCPITQSSIPSEPFVGTLRFVSVPTLQKLIDGNHLNVDGTQVNPYDDNNHIRIDFDGWVFPNGTSISNYSNQLSDAAFVFASNISAESFTVPTLTSFFESCGEPNGYSIAEEPQVIGLAKHEHSVSPIALSCDVVFNRAKTRIYSTAGYGGKNYIHQGKNDGSPSSQSADIQLPVKFKDKITDLSTTIDGSESGEQYWPAHNLIPIMIYIGGVLKEHYANIS